VGQGKPGSRTGQTWQRDMVNLAERHANLVERQGKPLKEGKHEIWFTRDLFLRNLMLRVYVIVPWADFWNKITQPLLQNKSLASVFARLATDVRLPITDPIGAL
jgi:hypothetical protein